MQAVTRYVVHPSMRRPHLPISLLGRAGETRRLLQAPDRPRHGAWICSLLIFILASCSTTKYVPEGSFLLDDLAIEVDNKEVKASEIGMYVRQRPNTKWFNLLKMQLFVYGWSGRDSTKWINRALRRLGDAPVIVDWEETERSRQEMTKAVQNLGYLGARVTSDHASKGKKLRITYHVQTGPPYIVRTIRHDIPDEHVAEYVRNDSAATLLRPGMYMDVNVLDQERQRISSLLRHHGYYRFNKEYITYSADTVRGTHNVDLTLRLALYPQGDSLVRHRQYTIDRIAFITEYDITRSSALSSIEINDSIHYQGYPIYYKDKLRLRPRVLTNALSFAPGEPYDEQAVQRTLSNFGRLQALKYTNIRFFETERADSTLLSAYVMLTRNKQHSVTFEIEGTNSAGDLGAAAAVSFQHRNLFHGSEQLMLRLRGAYEAVSGLQGNYRDEDYTEFSAEATLNFPRFMFPFLPHDFQRKIRASTEFGLQYSYQLRPEFTRIVASASWSYKWGGLQRRNFQHRIDLLDVSYLYMPWISEDFQEQYLEQDENYILKYNYEDRFIVRTGYSLVYNSAGSTLAAGNTITGNAYSVRFNLESAGNVLYLLGRMGAMKENDEGEYTLLNIPFAQYVRADLDFAKNFVIDERNSLAIHLGGGIVIPYGNATVVPLEKRYFAGGANSVRGWSIRDLGPGTFPGDGNYLNRTGDVKLDASVEYRTRLFWKFNGAFFVDAGNVWTIRNYEDQPGGQFRLKHFLKEVAVSYGLGLRLDLDFFILRFDGGMKAINPESGAKRYPISSPNFGRDFAIHFAVGYPF